MRASLAAVQVLFVLAFVSSAAFGSGPDLAGTMEARKILIDKENHETAVPAEKVYPNDRIEYTLRYRNVGDAVAAGVNLVGPIPAGTIYIDKTASENEVAHPRYSIDGGKSFSTPPIYYTIVNEKGEKEQRVAGPEMYTHIMWDITRALEPGKEVSVSYRVQVK